MSATKNDPRGNFVSASVYFDPDPPAVMSGVLRIHEIELVMPDDTSVEYDGLNYRKEYWKRNDVVKDVADTLGIPSDRVHLMDDNKGPEDLEEEAQQLESQERDES